MSDFCDFVDVNFFTLIGYVSVCVFLIIRFW